MATNPNQINSKVKSYATVTISTAATGLSDVIDLGGYNLTSIQMSTAWTAASLTFRASAKSSSNLVSVYKTTAVAELTYTTSTLTSTGAIFPVDPTFFAGMRYIQLRSGTVGTPVAQAAARTFFLGLSEPT